MPLTKTSDRLNSRLLSGSCYVDGNIASVTWWNLTVYSITTADISRLRSQAERNIKLSLATIAYIVPQTDTG